MESHKEYNGKILVFFNATQTKRKKSENPALKVHNFLFFVSTVALGPQESSR